VKQFKKIFVLLFFKVIEQTLAFLVKRDFILDFFCLEIFMVNLKRSAKKNLFLLDREKNE
jgi:hypothetical protein